MRKNLLEKFEDIIFSENVKKSWFIDPRNKDFVEKRASDLLK